MKKLTPKYRVWLIRRAKAELDKRTKRVSRRPGSKNGKQTHIVTAWMGHEFEAIVAENAPSRPPSLISVRSNSLETLGFLDEVRRRLNIKEAYENPGKYLWVKQPKSKRGKMRISNYMDFSAIGEISTAASLVLTAEYHRAARFVGSVPPVINLEDWNDGVFWPMYKIGFFEAIGHIEEDEVKSKNLHGIEYLRAISGTSGGDLEAVSANVQALVRNLSEIELDRSTRVELNSAIGEAIVNVSKWAYPANHTFEVPHLSNFWVTASLDPESRLFTIAIYDQGVTIPISYPKKHLSEMARSFLSKFVLGRDEFEYEDDGAYIACAMEFGSSSSGAAHRGKGLPQMRGLIEHVGNGSLMVCSRGGLWQYEYGKRPQYQSFEHSIGGTLIEWKISLPSTGDSADG